MGRDLDKTVAKMTSSLYLIDTLGKRERLVFVLNELGYSDEKLKDISKFINSLYKDQKDYATKLEHEAFYQYIKCIESLDKIMSMAKGYDEMGEINKTISYEDLHSQPEEGIAEDEVGRKEA